MEHMMSWMVPSLIATLVDTLVLTAVYGYIYMQYRERFMRLWTASWAVYAIRLGLELWILFTGTRPVLLALNHLSTIISGYLLLWGTYEFMEKKLPRVGQYLFFISAVIFIVSILSQQSFFVVTLPVFILTGAVYIWTGVVFLSYHSLSISGRMITGWAFIAWGIHKLNYPFVRPIEWLAPWGYLLAALLQITVAIGILLIYDQKVRRELSESDERSRSLFQNNHAVMLLIDPETGAILDANPAACSYYGWSREEITAMKITDINTLPPDQVFAEMQKSKAEKRKHFLFRHRTANGSVRDVEVYSGPIQAGGKTLLYSIVHDITRRREAEERLHATMTRLTALIDNMQDGILFEDRSRKIVLANRAFCEIFGLTAQPGDLIGMDSRGAVFMFAALFSSPESFAKRVEEIVNAETPVSDERLFLSDGRVLEMDYVPIYSHGSYLGHLWQYRDITEQKSLQDQLRHAQKMEAIGTLAGGVAHDFNNIITAIVGYGSLLKMNLKNDEQSTAYLEQILASADRAAALTKGLLAFSRKQPTAFQIVNIEDVVKRSLGLLKRLIGEDIELELDMAADTLTIYADPVHIEQVLMNLATNARDAMPNGGRLSIKTGKVVINSDFRRAHGFGKAGEYAFISVTDTGTGIDEKVKDRIFDPFFTTKETGKGTGLGLAVVYGIVKQHNGYITCESRPGQGAEFTIYLPLVHEETRQVHVSPFIPEPLRGNETLLVAEDDPAVRRLTKTVLEEFGYTVIEAEDGEDAVEKMKKADNNAKLAILDLVMPKKGGKEAYEEIIRYRKDIKALFMSGYADSLARLEDAHGQNGRTIQKPISPSELLKKVREVLDHERS